MVWYGKSFVITSHLREDRDDLLKMMENLYRDISNSDFDEPIQHINHLRAIAKEDIKRIGPLDNKRVLEIGPGKGVLLKMIQQSAAKTSAADLVPRYLEAIADTEIELLLLDIQDPQGIPSILENQFDVVVLTDVLEHLLLPADALLNCHKLLSPGGCLYVRVPAHESLISYSRQLGCPFSLVHVRTYTKGLLARELKASGFRLPKGPSYSRSALRVPRSGATSRSYWTQIRQDLADSWGRQLNREIKGNLTQQLRSAVMSGGENVSHRYVKRLFRIISMPITVPGAIYCIAVKS